MKTLLKVLRESHGYAMQFVATRLGISEADYGELELGKVALEPDHALALGELYDTHADHFLGTDKVMNHNSDSGRAITNVARYYEINLYRSYEK